MLSQLGVGTLVDYPTALTTPVAVIAGVEGLSIGVSSISLGQVRLECWLLSRDFEKPLLALTLIVCLYCNDAGYRMLLTCWRLLNFKSCTSSSHVL